MGKISAIQWTHSTLNLQMGCDGCELWTAKRKACYAGKQIDGDGNRPGFKGKKGYPARFDLPALFPQRMEEAESWRAPTALERSAKPWIPEDYPRVIFTNDMGDTFSKALPLDWLAPFLPRMAATPHQYLILTKRPSRMVEFSKQHELPPNVWPGTTVTTQQTMLRVEQLAQVRGGGPKFVSAEPLWENIDWRRMPSEIDWLILGGESGEDDLRIDMDLYWLDDAIAFARGRGLRTFVKQMGAYPYRSNDGARRMIELTDSHGGDWTEWAEEYRIRQMPLLPQTALL